MSLNWFAIILSVSVQGFRKHSLWQRRRQHQTEYKSLDWSSVIFVSGIQPGSIREFGERRPVAARDHPGLGLLPGPRGDRHGAAPGRPACAWRHAYCRQGHQPVWSAAQGMHWGGRLPFALKVECSRFYSDFHPQWRETMKENLWTDKFYTVPVHWESMIRWIRERCGKFWERALSRRGTFYSQSLTRVSWVFVQCRL